MSDEDEKAAFLRRLDDQEPASAGTVPCCDGWARRSAIPPVCDRFLVDEENGPERCRTCEHDAKCHGIASAGTVNAVLTREDLEHYRQNMRVASDAGDLWSDEYDAFSRVCEEVLALRAEVERLKHLLRIAYHGWRDGKLSKGDRNLICRALDAEGALEEPK